MTVGGVTTDYVYDGTMLVREFQINQQTGLLAPSVTYMAGPMGPCCRINEQNQSEGYYPAGVTSSTPLTRGVTRWYVYDGLGSKIAELDDNNNMTTSGQYDVYGAPGVCRQPRACDGPNYRRANLYAGPVLRSGDWAVC
jgi:YD repeat-containing protein